MSRASRKWVWICPLTKAENKPDIFIRTRKSSYKHYSFFLHDSHSANKQPILYLLGLSSKENPPKKYPPLFLFSVHTSFRLKRYSISSKLWKREPVCSKIFRIPVRHFTIEFWYSHKRLRWKASSVVFYFFKKKLFLTRSMSFTWRRRQLLQLITRWTLILLRNFRPLDLHCFATLYYELIVHVQRHLIRHYRNQLAFRDLHLHLGSLKIYFLGVSSSRAVYFLDRTSKSEDNETRPSFRVRRPLYCWNKEAWTFPFEWHLGNSGSSPANHSSISVPPESSRSTQVALESWLGPSLCNRKRNQWLNGWRKNSISGKLII